MAQDKKQHIDLNRSRTDNIGRVTTARLALVTGKHYNGGLDAAARVEWVGDHFVTRTMSIGGADNLGDFYVTLARTERTVKATQKAIDRLHDQTFTPEVIAEVTARANAWYDAQDAAKAAKAAKPETVHA